MMLWRYPNDKALRLPPLVLAYVGDAVFELVVRTHLAAGGAKVNRIHRSAVNLVSAKAMAGFYKKLEPYLTDEETEVLHRGRNVKSHHIKSAGVIQYHMSTGFEALVGYLFLSRQEQRLEELLQVILEAEDDEIG
ncbi:MAG: ribonuclease III [Peptococcaceae bacterium]|jgi:ribonuclease-3 family protein|nr:ribonuclease III [Peptococcaceae bacterium]